ncbi:hypothetical protein K432DRAFT_452922 [Lepidopterella palustris CBS 459.81]|uniref:Uncharacterized protein n=1 Tax=Lepidopterella palustris CBS 459.81 TaxID=1314670 RepID=A0A8E2DW35_9PEZI|nr:hypothetical protein K432DRAFT_452922 [Lepidopterella palustris CBS 459.81]
MPITSPKNRNIWKRDPRMSIHRNLEEVGEVAVASTSGALAQFISSARITPSILDDRSGVQFLAREVSGCSVS